MLGACPDGTLAEKVLVPASAVTPVPDTLRDVDDETCGLDIVGRASDPAGTSSALTIDYGEFMSSGWELIGNFMYPRQALRHLLRLVAAGLLDLDRIPRRPFPINRRLR